MFSKLLKNNLRKNMRWLWILFASTIVVSGITRGVKELGTTIAFFKVFGIVLDSVFYALLINSLIQPFLRSFLNFTKSVYGDESYLTHTLPVTKNQIINSKFLTTFIELSLAFLTVIISILIMFASPNLIVTLEFILSSLIVGKVSVVLAIVLFVLLVMVEFFMFISIIHYAIVMAYKSKEKRVLKSFLYTAVFSFAAITILGIIMVMVLLINDVNLEIYIKEDFVADLYEPNKTKIKK